MNGRNAVYILLLVSILGIANSQSVFGQGKLARVRDKVRETSKDNDRRESANNDRERHQEPRADRNRKPRVEQNREPQRHSRGNHRNRRPQRSRKSRRNRGFNFVVGPRIIAPPVETVHVVHHVPPVIGAQSVLVEPPIVAEPVFVPQPVSPEPIYQEVVSPEVHSADAFTPTANIDWGIRLSAIGATDFNDIAQANLGLLLQSYNGLGLDVGVTMIRESGMSYRDHLYLGDVNLVYEPLVISSSSGNSFRLRLGIGVNWLGDSWATDAGFNMTSGFDWQLSDRYMATGEIDFGSIGDTDITHAQISLGRLITQSTEWTVGYDHLDIGGVTIGSAFTGLRFRF